ncbi:MAG: GTPase HflX [Candidatus Bathyarchaeia archaeon]
MDELKSLAEAAGYEVVGSLEQVTRPHSHFHIGRGKAAELAEMAKKLGAEKIIFGNELKTIQTYNLAKIIGTEIIDRLQLILEIFQKRASTEEAKLQIELARWRHELAQAREKVKLARLGEQPGFHGLGKYEVDVYHESVKRQVHNIEKKLEIIKKTRQLHRNIRRKMGFQTISLAGYTNSGKSTLFNALTRANVPVDSNLFTTLSTTTRAIEIENEKILVTDTVGFIDDLPISLVKAFHSTLEETSLSDLILLVVDVSEPLDEIERKLSCCLDTIREIGASGIPTITVLNKIDLISEKMLDEKMKNMKPQMPSSVPISALFGKNLDLLIEEIKKYLVHHLKSIFTLPLTEKSFPFLSWVFDHTNVQDVEYKEDTIQVSTKASNQITSKIKNNVENLGGVFKLVQMENLGS